MVKKKKKSDLYFAPSQCVSSTIVPPQTRHQHPGHAELHARGVGEDQLQLAGSGPLPLDPPRPTHVPRPGLLQLSGRDPGLEAGGRRQEAGGWRQEAGGRRQEAGGRRLEASLPSHMKGF